MINVKRLTVAEAAEALGVKPQTLYAYVSRGLLSRQRDATRQHLRRPRGGAAGSIVSAGDRRRPVSPRRPRPGLRDRADPDRGRPSPLPGVGRRRAEPQPPRSRRWPWWLWTGAWPDGAPVGRIGVDDASGADRYRRGGSGVARADHRAHRSVQRGRGGCRRGRRSAPRSESSGGQDHRSGRHRCAARQLADGLAAPPPAAAGPESGDGPASGVGPGSVAARLWPRLSALPATPPRVAVLDAALVLVADHELAPVDAGGSGGGDVSGQPLRRRQHRTRPRQRRATTRGAPPRWSRCSLTPLASDPERAIGLRLQHGRLVHGFGMRLYPDGDPRRSSCWRRLDEVDGAGDRRRRGGPGARHRPASAAFRRPTSTWPSVPFRAWARWSPEPDRPSPPWAEWPDGWPTPSRSTPAPARSGCAPPMSASADGRCPTLVGLRRLRGAT